MLQHQKMDGNLWIVAGQRYGLHREEVHRERDRGKQEGLRDQLGPNAGPKKGKLQEKRAISHRRDTAQRKGRKCRPSVLAPRGQKPEGGTRNQEWSVKTRIPRKKKEG